MTTWPRMDIDPPGSWNGVVQTPLRKLWVQCQRVATSLSKVHGLVSGSGYAVATLAVQSSHCLRRLSHAHHHSCQTQRRLGTTDTALRGGGDNPTAGASRASSWETDPRSLRERGSSGYPWQGLKPGVLGPSPDPPKRGSRTPPKRGVPGY